MGHDYNWYEPECIYLASGSAEGGTDLNAFDNALMDAGITEFNLIEVSSIAPPGTPIKYLDIEGVVPAKGLLAPTIYEEIHTEDKGVKVASAVGVGIPDDYSQQGLIFANSCRGTAEEAREGVKEMIEEGMERHGLGDYSVKTAADSVKADDTHVTAVSAVMFADSELNKVIRKEIEKN